MTNGVPIRPRKLVLVGLGALAATALLLLVLNRAADRREEQPESMEALPESMQRLPDWVKAWQEATPDERVGIAERIGDEEPLIALTVEESIFLLGPPRLASWRCGTVPTFLYPFWPLKERVFLVVSFDEEGFVEEVDFSYHD